MIKLSEKEEQVVDHISKFSKVEIFRVYSGGDSHLQILFKDELNNSYKLEFFENKFK